MVVVVVVVVVIKVISKWNRHTHKSMNKHMTQTKTVTPVHGSQVHLSGWTLHERQYQNSLPS
jgi:phage antirepressor YoqD-like protein